MHNERDLRKQAKNLLKRARIEHGTSRTPGAQITEMKHKKKLPPKFTRAEVSELLKIQVATCYNKKCHVNPCNVCSTSISNKAPSPRAGKAQGSPLLPRMYIQGCLCECSTVTVSSNMCISASFGFGRSRSFHSARLFQETNANAFKTMHSKNTHGLEPSRE